MKNYNIGFIGCGKMASAIIKGITKSNFVNPENVIASKSSGANLEEISAALGIEITLDNKKVAQKSDIIFIAVKPNQVESVLDEIKDVLSESSPLPNTPPRRENIRKVIVSVVAGVTIKFIQEKIGQIPVIRVMPNTPILVNEGMSGISKGHFATEEHINYIEKMLSTIGKCVIVDESQIDIVTAISGSGPAFFYKIINEIALAGEKLGLEYDKALLLSIQTALGSAKMALNRTIPMEELISNVATKGGCTRVGVDCMDENNTEELFFNIIKSTTSKAKALGQ